MTNTSPLRAASVTLASLLVLGGLFGVGALSATADESVDPQVVSSASPTDPAADATATPTPTPTDPAVTTIELASPVAGSTAISRTVPFLGTAPAGSTVTVTGADGAVLGQLDLGSKTIFAIAVTYGPDAATTQTATVTGTLDGKPLNSITRSFTLPAQDLPAPVITAPANGSTVYGTSVTIGGTGVPGKNVVVSIIPTSVLAAATQAKSANAVAAAPDNPADPIIVDQSGNWSVTVALDPNDYTITAALAEVDAQGKLVSLLSGESAPVEFVLSSTVAPVIVIPTSTPTPTPTPTAAPAAATTTSPQLANTGSDLMPLGLAAALLGGLGAAFIVARRLVGSVRR